VTNRVAKTVLTIAAVAATATALVFSALFYSAARKQTAAAAPAAQVDSGTQPAPAPVTTRTS
jgi:hypothetical protein